MFTEGRHPGEFLLGDLSSRSRGKGVVVAGSGVFPPGMVLGVIGIGSAVGAIKAGGNTGNGVMTLDADPVREGVTAGVYTITAVDPATNGGRFSVEDPRGNVIGFANVGVAFADQVAFTIADGATDFILGDGFTVTVNPGSLKLAPSPDEMTEGIEGAEVATCIALYGGDASTNDVEIAIVARDQEVNALVLSYDASVDTPDKQAAKLAQLAAVGIIAR